MRCDAPFHSMPSRLNDRTLTLFTLVVCAQVIENHLKGRDYNEALIPQWINDICESTMEELHAPKKPFKYVGQCT